MRTIDSDGKQLGIMPISQAIAIAQARGLDLVEVAPTANPPVCKIVDYGKFRYEQEKREREARRHQHATKLKEIKLRLNIDPHDYATKLNHIHEFLNDRMKVKVSVFFRGRENARPEFGEQLMQRVINDVAGWGRPEAAPRLVGRSIHMILAPARGAAARKTQPAAGRADKDADAAPAPA